MINRNYVNVSNSDRRLYDDKINTEYWSNVNKRYLLRIYEPLRNTIEYLHRPKWVSVVYMMLGRDVRGYYSCVYKALKEIGVIKYNKKDRVLEKGPNWDRFYGSEDWSWFVMNTNSGIKSYVKTPLNTPIKKY
jgi:hypothetical protein